MNKKKVIVITGTRKGIGKYLAEYYSDRGFQVIGCSRETFEHKLKNYQHFCLDVCDENKVKQLFTEIRRTYKRVDVLINNAGIASMNHFLLTPLKTVESILNTNIVGTFLFCREASKLMKVNKYGRIINFTTVAVPLKLEGESIYAASKAAVISLTEILAKELADFGITVNAIGPTPTKTDLIRTIPQEKIKNLINKQAIRRFTEFKDISNVIDFFIQPESNFVTGQTIFLGGI
ncbi:MAG: SDR family oxidoreductase [bacterium]